jgi:formamidopyrimidine-DNA glycosylase
MPELPEVETVRRTLERALAGRRIVGVARIGWPRTIATPTPEQLCAALCDRQILGVDRRAKYLLIRLDHDEALVVHLRMTGRLLVVDAQEPLDDHTHVVLALDNGQELRFRDVRKFGRISLLDSAALTALDEGLGVEPLEDGFSDAVLAQRLERRRGKLKPLLLDQRVIAGLGNIYVDEALWRSGLHPLRSAESLTPEEVARLYEAIRTVLASAVERRGTTLSDYRDALGAMGDNQHYLAVYGRAGQPCPRCGAAIERTVVGQRGTHLCPHCQRVPGS